MHDSRHLALEFTALLAAVPGSKVTRFLPITPALVYMARGAIQKSITAEESVRYGMTAALGR